MTISSDERRIIAKAELAYRSAGSYAKAARPFGLSGIVFWRAINDGYVSPQLAKAFVKPRDRVRFAADVSPGLRDAIRAEAEALELTNGELLELMFGNWIIYDEVT